MKNEAMTDAVNDTTDQVLAAVTEMLKSVIGEDELLMVDEVTMETSFSDALEL